MVENLEVIVERKRREIAILDYELGRSWLDGFEQGLKQAKANLEKAKGEPFFLVLANAVPTAETKNQLLFAFTDVIMDEIDERRAEQMKVRNAEAAVEVAEARARLKLTSGFRLQEEEVKVLHTEEPAQEEMYVPSNRLQLSMMDGVRQWFASNEIMRHAMKIFDVEKLWKTV